jgi:hypothetical protein
VKRKNAYSGGSLVTAALVAVGWWLYSRHPRERVPSQESLGDPDVARAFNRVAALPQMRLLRWFVTPRNQRDPVWRSCRPGMRARAPGRRVDAASARTARDGH